MRIISRSGIQPAIIHSIVWLLIFSFPLIFYSNQNSGKQVDFYHLVYPFIQAVIIFYLNYSLLADRFYFRRKYFTFILINLAIVLLFRFDWMLINLFDSYSTVDTRSKTADISGGIDRLKSPVFIIQTVFMVFLPAILALVLKSVLNRGREEVDKRETENKNLQAELQQLKYQLHPHFFFNSLNNIYALIDLSPSRAQEAIHSLGKMMRYMLHETNLEKVSLKNEIDFLKKYIQLMEIRKKADVKVECSFPRLSEKDYLIAPLLLIPLIENLYKHGVSIVSPLLLQFEISVRNRQLHFKSTNPVFRENVQQMHQSGIGVENLRKRLQLIYPGKHFFQCIQKDGIFITELNIQLDE